jgi:hypothetical protein
VAIVSALATAYLNIEIPQSLGRIVNVVASFVKMDAGDGGQVSENFVFSPPSPPSPPPPTPFFQLFSLTSVGRQPLRYVFLFVWILGIKFNSKITIEHLY